MRRPGGRVRTDAVGIPWAALDDLIIVMRNSNEERDVCPLIQIQDDARILYRLPGRLQKEPVLRIHIRRFARRDSEELRIKLVDPIEKSAAPGDGFSNQTRLRIVESLDIPAIRRAPRIPPRGLPREVSKMIQRRLRLRGTDNRFL